jgi:hypothetical protein
MSFVFFPSAFVVCLYFAEAELEETRKRAKTSEAHAPQSQHNMQHGSHTHPQTIKTPALVQHNAKCANLKATRPDPTETRTEPKTQPSHWLAQSNFHRFCQALPIDDFPSNFPNTNNLFRTPS